ncbi:hypothetical protein LTR37_015051 [Vermiconidia calcicola]|uniref:Uncharacterized protein n=1 Tax=Vermiconidia calcicola TaxID=1690605 RepID=A0ACC3MSZ7_9PEZI|nr:hypothetical protein LTR37_015051 [Vermiconidia calcicola]
MARILLSQSQVTVVISTGLIVIFALLLFLSGYVVQQRTVTGIQSAIRPRIPKPPPSQAAPEQQPAEPQLQASRLFGSRGEGHVAFTDFEKAADSSANVNWSRLAHVQLVKNHHEVCSAIMVLAELHRLRSPARRVLLFPQGWATEKKAGKGEISDPFLAISRRLMKAAARRYGVELRPVSPLFPAEEGGAEDVYSLASAYALTDFDRVLSIETPGLLVDASPLDAVLAFTESAPFAMLHDTTDGDGVHAEDLFLLQPSSDTHTLLKQDLANQQPFNDGLIPTSFPDPLLLDSSSEHSALIRSIGTLHEAGSNAFNATAFLSDVSYIRFSDPKLPGPEYDVPWAEKVAARPKNKDADWTWTKLYGQFAQKRMEVCGLDLEFWRP